MFTPNILIFSPPAAQSQQGSEPPASGFLIRRFEDRYVKSGCRCGSVGLRNFRLIAKYL
jgi:hypothetical protein